MSRGVKEYFEQVSSQWDTLQKGFYGEEVRDSVLVAARILSNQTVLDVGAGTGFLTEAAARKARKVIALDFSECMLAEARTRLRENVEFKLGTAEQIPLPDASVNAVIGNMILHHCPDPEKAASEMVRVLIPGGRLVLSDLQEHSYESLRREHADLWLGFKTERVGEILASVGLEDVSVEPLGSCCSERKDNTEIKIPIFLASGHKHR